MSLRAPTVWAASLTPLTASLAIDSANLAVHVKWLLAIGCDGVALMGTTGEANSLTVRERQDALGSVLQSGVDPDRIMFGAGCCAYPDSVELTRFALDAGVRRILLLPPFYYKSITDEGLYLTFRRIIDEVGSTELRVYLYHFPQMSAVPLSHGLIGRLIDSYPRVMAGMKDSGGSWKHMELTVRTFPEFEVFAGTERYLLDMIGVGGAGCITATANLTCPLAAQVIRTQSPAVQAHLTRVRTAIERWPMIPALKALQAHRTGADAWSYIRPPHAPLTAADAEACIGDLEAAATGTILALHRHA